VKWRQYQEAAAALLRSLGFAAIVEAKIAGARGLHTIDVHATHAVYGFTITWIVECKYWNKAVPKEKVLVLNQVAADIGADRAFLLSESGFQSGALMASQHANVTLTSLPDLRDAVQAELARIALARIAQQIYRLEKRAQALFSPRLYWLADGLGEHLLDLLARAFSLKSLALPQAQAGEFPVHMLDDAAPCPDLPTFLARAEKEIVAIADALDQATAQSQQVGSLAPSVARDFSTAVITFLEASERALSASSDSEHERSCMEALAPMYAIGDHADKLRSLLPPEPRQRLRAVMRALIDGPYVLLTLRGTAHDDWSRARALVVQCLEDFQCHFAAVGGGDAAPPDELSGSS
jgi:hypothetical protein